MLRQREACHSSCRAPKEEAEAEKEPGAAVAKAPKEEAEAQEKPAAAAAEAPKEEAEAEEKPAVAAAEAAVGLALVILLFRNKVTVDLDDLNLLKG